LIIPSGVKEARITCHRAHFGVCFSSSFFFIARARLSLRGIGDFPGIKFAPCISEYLFFSCLVALKKSLNRCALATKRIPVEGYDYWLLRWSNDERTFRATTLDLAIKPHSGSFCCARETRFAIKYFSTTASSRDAPTTMTDIATINISALGED